MIPKYEIDRIGDTKSRTPSPATHSIRKKSSRRRKRNIKRRKPSKKRRKSSLKESTFGSKLSNKQTLVRSPSSKLSSTGSSDSISSKYFEDVRIRRVKKIYNMLLTCQACGILIFYPVALYHFPCSPEEESLNKFDNLVAYVLMLVCLGCVVFSLDVQNTVPYNYIYAGLSIAGLAYIGGKVVCRRQMVLILETAVIVGVEEFCTYLISIYSTYDFTPTTPALTYAYTITTALNIIAVYFVYSNVPIIMLSIINTFLTLGLLLCVSQFPMTRNPKYRLPENENLFGTFMLHSLVTSLMYHTYLLVINLFDEQ